MDGVPAVHFMLLLSPPLVKGDLGGFEPGVGNPPYPPFAKGGDWRRRWPGQMARLIKEETFAGQAHA